MTSPSPSGAGNSTLPSDQDASGRSFAEEEQEAVRRVLEDGVLVSTKGERVRELEQGFADLVGTSHVVACASGTAAIHAAVVAIDPEPGDEIITSPVTDMGALAPILYQSAIPIFADVDPKTLNVTAESLQARLSPRTRALVVTHLFGMPCAMDDILALARQRGLPVIEDCAQAYCAEWQGRQVGTLGDVAAFSLQQGKHITCGEGGLVTTDDERLARRMRLFVNKAWSYGEPSPDHEFLALNSRLSELQGAVAHAQLERLVPGVRQRRAMAERLTKQLDGATGFATPRDPEGGVASYWKYLLNVDPAAVPGGADAVAAELRTHGIASAPRYIRKPAFECRVFREQRTFGNSRYPFTLARDEAVDYAPERFPGVFQGLEQALVLPWNERYEARHVDFLADALRSAHQRLRPS